MNTGRQTLWTALYFLALAALAGGVIVTALAPFHWVDLQRRVARKDSELQKMMELEQVADRQKRAVTAFEQLPSPMPPSLSEQIQAVLPGVQSDIRPGDAQEVGEAWSLRTATVVLQDIRYDDVVQLCRALETNRPPWRVAAIHLRAGQQELRAQTAELAVEALERVAAAP